MFYDAKCWANKQKISVAKMKLLRWIRLASIDQKIKGELFEMIWSCAKESDYAPIRNSELITLVVIILISYMLTKSLVAQLVFTELITLVVIIVIIVISDMLAKRIVAQLVGTS